MTADQYTQIVNLNADTLFGFISKQGIGLEDARDMMQNCFEALWKSKINNIEEGSKYIYGVAHHQIADFFRKPIRVIYKENVPESQLSLPNQTPHQQLLHKALLTLSEQDRSLILLKDYQGYSYEEIAKITQLNNSQVKVYLHRARIKIQEQLGTLKQVI
jgi:RNA polymerase sigma factor (sigma-70 family)